MNDNRLTTRHCDRLASVSVLIIDLIALAMSYYMLNLLKTHVIDRCVLREMIPIAISYYAVQICPAYVLVLFSVLSAALIVKEIYLKSHYTTLAVNVTIGLLILLIMNVYFVSVMMVFLLVGRS